MHLLVTMSVFAALEVPTAHTALKTLTNALACNFQDVTGLEKINRQRVTDFLLGSSGQADFTNVGEKSRAGLGEVTLHCLVGMLFLAVAESNLQSIVAVLLNGFHLSDGARTGFNNCNGHRGTIVPENTGHAKLATYNSHFLSHDCLSLKLNFNVNAGGKRKLAEGVNSLLGRLNDIHESLVHAHLELFTGLLVNMHRTLNRKFVNPGGQGDWPGHTGTGVARSVHDFRYSLIKDAEVIGPELDPNAITANCRHFLLRFTKIPRRLGSTWVPCTGANRDRPGSCPALWERTSGSVCLTTSDHKKMYVRRFIRA